MMIRVPRRASPKTLFLTLLLVCLIAIPLKAANQVATSESPPADGYGFVYDGATADSTAGGAAGGEEGDPTDIDQILEILISLVAAIQRCGL